MKYPMFSIKDDKTGFSCPTCDQSEASAVRNFSFAVNNSDTVMGFAPKDYDLYKVGEFDTDSGKIRTFVPEFVVSGSSVFGVNDK